MSKSWIGRLAVVVPTLLVAFGVFNVTAQPAQAEEVQRDCSSGNNEVISFAAPIKHAKVKLTVALKRDAIVNIKFKSANGAEMWSYSNNIGDYWKGLPETTYELPSDLPNPELGVSNVSTVEVKMGSRTPSDTLLCNAVIQHDGVLDGPSALECLTTGWMHFPLAVPHKDTKVAVDIALRHDMIMNVDFYDAAKNKLFHWDDLIGKYYGGLPLQTLTFPPSGNGIYPTCLRSPSRSGDGVSTPSNGARAGS